MKKFSGFLLLTRPVNVLIGMLSIFIGALITGTINPLQQVLLACFSGGLIAGAANAINDYFDLEIDRINRPDRPLPAGKVSLSEARDFAYCLFLLGILLGALVNLPAFIIAFFSAVLLYLYSARLKRTLLWGNLSASLVTALAFIYGGVAVNRFYESLIPAGFSFLFHLGREIIKDTQDVAGDAANNAVTLPIHAGEKIALKTATGIFVLLVFLTLLPYFFKIYGVYYLLTVVVGVDLVIVGVLISVWRDSSPKNLRKMSNLLKADMLVGLVAIFLGTY
jgi:geranylgeranylglycerol-phosphate geranylgeranyltransferase